MKKFAKAHLPKPVFHWLKRIRDGRRRRILAVSRSRAEVFSAIYNHRMWGGSGSDFHSGWGSHDADAVGPYVRAVAEYLQSSRKKPDVCDIGCGDFAVGSQLRSHCARYIACDVVPELIDRNQRKFADADVDFRTLDLVTDPLPDADIAFVRQVFQHLSNKDIADSLHKFSKFKAVIVTEDVPHGEFEPNHDKPAGFDVRLSTNSGVDLSAPPFQFPLATRRTLCRVEREGQVLLTTVYEKP